MTRIQSQCKRNIKGLFPHSTYSGYPSCPTSQVHFCKLWEVQFYILTEYVNGGLMLLIYEILELLISQLIDVHDLFQVLHIPGMVLQEVWHPHVLNHS